MAITEVLSMFVVHVIETLGYFGVFIMNGRVFGQDGDATFSFLIVGVHDPFLYLLVGTEYTALLQHSVYQGGLAVVDVSDDGNVTQIISNHKSPIPSYFQINQEDARQRSILKVNYIISTFLLYAFPICMSN